MLNSRKERPLLNITSSDSFHGKGGRAGRSFQKSMTRLPGSDLIRSPKHLKEPKGSKVEFMKVPSSYGDNQKSSARDYT